ncbi:MAG: peptidoglycan DD-metalloendopeptidase family protein [Solobacterium sp.]|nr:peptidoglycan DD-metalloendopeptidase family protein [Solobacterium sp.]
MMKKTFMVIACFLCSILIVFFMPSSRSSSAFESSAAGMFEQKITGISASEKTIYKLYDRGNLVGVLTSRQRLDRFLDSVYREKYEKDYPNSSCICGKDIYITEEKSLLEYEDIDENILNYLLDNELFALRATAVCFADDTDIFARIYVLDETIYENAMQTFITYFIDPDVLASIEQGYSLPLLSSYGTREVGISISETITMYKDYAAPSEIMRTEEEVLEYLEYGANTTKEYYTVQKYDTVAGVGTKNYGLSATQVMNINRDKIESVDQVLEEGQELCITYFNSPVNVVVYKETLREEAIYPETIYTEDPSLLVNETEVRQVGEAGSRNSLYSEKWINGVLVNGYLESSVDMRQPVSEVVAVGTMELPDVGTGTYRWPVNNPIISCGWGCYWGHRGTDIVNEYEPYGDIYAADRGVVEKNEYHYINGNYIVINHNNGFHTYYGHMREPSELEVGTVVDKGQVIGHIGMTGAATGPHVHFFIYEDDETRHDACQGFLPC